jgi:hypothetical protein
MSDPLKRIWEEPSMAYFSAENCKNSQIGYKIAFQTQIRSSTPLQCRHFIPPTNTFDTVIRTTKSTDVSFR